MKEFESKDTSPVTKKDIQDAANEIGCDPAAIEAVSLVEASGSGFIAAPDNRPKILFEAHSFHTLTKGIYDDKYPNISSPNWDRSLYGTSGSHQYDRLQVAISLNRAMALESASWGKYQIMGSNFYDGGYDNIEEFVTDMVSNEDAHLWTFVTFLQNTGIDRFLKNHDWEHFALRYNGPGQVSHYADNISSAYDKAVAAGWNK